MSDTTYSMEVLEETPARVTRMLSGIGRYTELRTQLAARGLTDAEITLGHTLLLACLASPAPAGAPPESPSAQRQREAVALLDAWDEPNFPRFHAALRRFHPDVGEVLFRDLKPATGAAAVTGVATFVVRIEGLVHAARSARDRSPAPSEAVLTAASAYESVPVEARRAALALLEARGLTADERTRLRDLVNTALGPTAVAAPNTAEVTRLAQRTASLTALRVWFDDWAATIRACVHKKSHLIAMGFASRKVTAKDEKKPPVT